MAKPGPLMYLFYRAGFLIRETGQAIDRLGMSFQGNYAYRESLCRHRTVMNLFSQKPQIENASFIAPSASLIGSVKIGNKSSVWYGSVLRGDAEAIQIGENTHIQDRAVVNVVSATRAGPSAPTIIGDRVLVGPAATLHCCRIHDEAFVGAGAVVLDGAEVQKHAIVAPGSVVERGMIVKSGEYWAGSPAKFVRKVTKEEIDSLLENVQYNSELAQLHQAENSKPFIEVELERTLRQHAQQLAAEDQIPLRDMDVAIHDALAEHRKRVGAAAVERVDSDTLKQILKEVQESVQSELRRNQAVAKP
eukprot:TRINITY_DN87_c0_g1::TRINITY_DN87_c0_g1_i1::g.14790::m.14790 TRINITY_DN87_c0_g1::TRINITY_DN87_c0_g1_i1::g.14790  ORF type:complete len:328 (+),score=50.15,sp/Q9FWR5/GCA1_ARATH/49.57/9e-79,Hexapep/PF00132.19/0.0002,Hexapep/PF00132.19/5.3,Hexapep/PF00132.19/7.5e-06,Hexapep/PF00132.19/2.9e-06,Hexapep_2/PF14602.1/77,Hexapep_2/PF14602.1/2.3e+02,Hexapep_2/PF14602.1/0.37,Hexapep_2/PF14602.1/0.011 TRINITY_DN87_c0_g1_i1:70-984(+)